MIGFVSVWLPENFIHHLYVQPEYQGIGAGPGLLNHVVSSNPDPWKLKCSERNVKDRAFYRCLGWHELSRAVGDEDPYWNLQ